MEPTPQNIRVLVVDDSMVIRSIIRRTLNNQAGVEVAAVASNGKLAIDLVKNETFHIILLDIEMPEMDGITALPELVANARGARIIMSSSLTQHGAEITMKALSLGADDYIPKPTSSSGQDELDRFNIELASKVMALGSAVINKRTRLSPPPPRKPEAAPLALESPNQGDIAKAERKTLRATNGQSETSNRIAESIPQAPLSQQDNFTLVKKAHSHKPHALAIGSSTGGPQALTALFEGLRGKIDFPVFITQHMPATFTRILAENITKTAGYPAMEAISGTPVRAGNIYIAPGDYHMAVNKNGTEIVLSVNQNPPENFCRPAVDPMLRSLIGAYGNRLLTVILTGMGSDGARGAVEVQKAGGVVVAQDEASSVVWGMPGATAKAGCCTAVLPINEIPGYIIRSFAGGGE